MVIFFISCKVSHIREEREEKKLDYTAETPDYFLKSSPISIVFPQKSLKLILKSLIILVDGLHLSL